MIKYAYFQELFGFRFSAENGDFKQLVREIE